MVFIILATAFVISAWKWGDWKNWKLYHSTILYFVLGDMFYNYLSTDYPLWLHLPVDPIHRYLVVKLLVQLCFVCTALIYLGRYPKERWKAILWIGFWVTCYSLIEGGLILMDAMKHYNGWTFLHSVFFNCMMFPMLRLHFKRPLLAYILSVPIVIALLKMTQLPFR